MSANATPLRSVRPKLSAGEYVLSLAVVLGVVGFLVSFLSVLKPNLGSVLEVGIVLDIAFIFLLFAGLVMI
jgi:hypothetical protein